VARPTPRQQLARVAAPAAFLAAATIAILLVRAGLREDDPAPAGTNAAATTVATTTQAPTTTRRRPATTRTTQTQPEPVYHVIESGDTFGTLASQYDTTVDRLEQLNPGVDTTALVVGQRVRVG
jgi:LysM repeat protein